MLVLRRDSSPNVIGFDRSFQIKVLKDFVSESKDIKRARYRPGFFVFKTKKNCLKWIGFFE